MCACYFFLLLTSHLRTSHNIVLFFRLILYHFAPAHTRTAKVWRSAENLKKNRQNEIDKMYWTNTDFIAWGSQHFWGDRKWFYDSGYFGFCSGNAMVNREFFLSSFFCLTNQSWYVIRYFRVDFLCQPSNDRFTVLFIDFTKKKSVFFFIWSTNWIWTSRCHFRKKVFEWKSAFCRWNTIISYCLHFLCGAFGGCRALANCVSV